MKNAHISQLLIDDYQMLTRYVEGKTIKKILTCTENRVSLLMEDGIIVNFIQLEDELIFDIEASLTVITDPEISL